MAKVNKQNPFKTNKKILLLEGIHPFAKKHLEEAGFAVDLETTALSGAKLLERAQGYAAVGIRSKTNLKSDFFEKISDLTVVGAFCIGTNQIDLEAANKHGVPVFNAPYSNTRSVAELVLAEMIALARQLGDRSQNAHKGVWQKSAEGSREVRGKVLGIVGYGHIGTQLSVLAESLGLKVIFYDIVKKLPIGNARPKDSLKELLKEADFVSLHVPETRLTKGMIGASELKVAKKGCYVLNASRGTVVDIPALAQALKTKHVAGAAIDVFPHEPENNKEPFKSELQGLENVILTPHVGGSTEEAQEAIGLEVAESLLRFLAEGATGGAVNFPRLEIPALQRDSADGNLTRLVNVHRNVPGVLGDINGIVSEAGANIVAQYLSTDANIGYLVMDTVGSKAEKMFEQVDSLKTSIKTRLI